MRRMISAGIEETASITVLETQGATNPKPLTSHHTRYTGQGGWFHTYEYPTCNYGYLTGHDYEYLTCKTRQWDLRWRCGE